MNILTRDQVSNMKLLMDFYIKSINYPDKMNAKLDDSFSNFIINTRSESEFNWYYQNLKQNAEIIYNDDYLSRN